jgi:predicted porin
MMRMVSRAVVIGSIVSGGVHAQVNLFTGETTRAYMNGTFHGAVESYKVDGATPASDADGVRLQSHSSRLGFGVVQQVLEDLSVVAAVEAGVSLTGADDGSTPFASTRNTYIGLVSKRAGEIRFGRHDVAYKLVTTVDNLFPDQLGENDNIISEGAGRADDTVIYFSPKWNDVRLLASVSQTDLREYSSDKLANDQVRALEKGYNASAGLIYQGDYGYLGLGFETQKGDQITSTNVPSGYDSTVISVGTPKWNGLSIVGAAELRQGKNRPDQKNYSIGAVQTIGKFAIKGNYAWKNVDADAANTELITVGASYSPAKALEFYATYSILNNQSNAKLDFSDGPIGRSTGSSVGLSNGDDLTALALGMITRF